MKYKNNVDESINKIIKMYFEGYSLKEAIEIIKDKISKEELSEVITCLKKSKLS